jgi:hypothetical protein
MSVHAHGDPREPEHATDIDPPYVDLPVSRPLTDAERREFQLYGETEPYDDAPEGDPC